MSKLSDLRSRLQSLHDIAAILDAMKNLSLAEITKISRFYTLQQELFHTIELALEDFQHFYGPQVSVETSRQSSLYILIGSERGFCGGFNDEIRRQLETEVTRQQPAELILVGRKLSLMFADDPRVRTFLNGPNTTEEIPRVISALAGTLTQFPGREWKIIHNVYKNEGMKVETSSPFTTLRRQRPANFEFAPLLNLPASELRPQLFEQYLFALFYGIFYLSFIAENHERLRHMESALNKLDEETQRLRRVSNSLRQEVITEELEVIMTSVDL
ncbi:MAG TPA: FoF1 ATP synthase subunit gamma [Acidobacteriaceae bacterium]|nr:FoF1 ATP synthase subunit gamma [Acidobacteriaceae bacterium]